MKKIWNHPWCVATCNILLVMAIYTIMRLFYYWINIDLFPNVSPAHLLEMCLGGLRFDLTAILYLSSVYLLLMLLPLPWKWRMNRGYQKTALWLFWIPNILGVFSNAYDTVYAHFSDRRTTITFFTEFHNDKNLFTIFMESVVEWWYIALFLAAIIAILIVLTRRQKTEDTYAPAYIYFPAETVILCLSAYMIVIGIRGGFGAYTRPITLSNALQYANAPRETMLILNTPFSLMRSSDSKAYKRVTYFKEDEVSKLMTPEHAGQSAGQSQVGTTNVVVLILESFSKEYFGFYNKQLDNGTFLGYTPFLDSLIQESTTFKYSFASGRKSIDAMPSILSSIPMLIEPYIVSPYSTNAVSSLAACLRQEGYNTAFFHGAPNGSMGFEAYARSARFERYYGLDEYEDKTDDSKSFDGTWAIWDEEFLQYYAQTMSEMQEPFMTAVFTASSHHPFRVPKRYEGVFPKGDKPIHQCIGYSDHALRKFFEFAQTQPWYEHTLFVLTADHTNLLSHPTYCTSKGIFEVPIIFYRPGQEGRYDTTSVISQTDIMPSVLEYLNYDKPYFAFGENCLTKTKEHPYAICYNNPEYQILSDSLMVQFDGNVVTGVYNHAADPLLKHNLVDQPSEQRDMMADYLRAYIQQYVNRMIDNELTIEKQ